jgi:hypothetical protein
MRGDTIERWVLRVTGFAGLAIFATFFVFTWATPQWVEDFGADYIEGEVIERVDAGIDGIKLPQGDNAVARFASALVQKNEEKIASLQRLKSRARELLASALAQVRDPDCACRIWLENAINSGVSGRILTLQADNQQITGFIQGTYLKTAADLKRDIRIFAASNSLCFLMLIAISFAKPQAIRHLFVPGILLFFAALLCAGMYVFEQNWLLTIIHGNYLGFAYLAYLGVVFLFFCDIVLNRGRVTTTIANGFADAVGSAASLVPC